MGLVAMERLERPFNEFLLDCFQADPVRRQSEVQIVDGCVLLPKVLKEVFDRGLVFPAQHDESLDHVFEFPNSPRPAIVLEVLHQAQW